MARGKIEKRGQRRRKTKPVILIVTEGSQTEPKYFEHYRNRRTNIDIRVVGSRTSGGETDYLSLIRKAVEYQNKNQISVSEGDSVWVVADGDVNYNNPDPITAKDSLLSKARKMADAKGIQIALSNPCFEFWYLLHFQYTTKFFKDYPLCRLSLPLPSQNPAATSAHPEKAFFPPAWVPPWVPSFSSLPPSWVCSLQRTSQHTAWEQTSPHPHGLPWHQGHGNNLPPTDSTYHPAHRSHMSAVRDQGGFRLLLVHPAHNPMPFG